MAWVKEITARCSPEALTTAAAAEPGVALLRSFTSGAHGRYSLVAARPFLVVRTFGSRLELIQNGRTEVQFGNPWTLLEALIARYELLEELDLPFPLGGCFGYWGYGLRTALERGLPERSPDDLGLPDCHAGFYDSLVVFDHQLHKQFVIATGLKPDGSITRESARAALDTWEDELRQAETLESAVPFCREFHAAPAIAFNLDRSQFIQKVERAQRYIRAGDIYQVNLSQRLAVPLPCGPWRLFERLAEASPAPFAAFLDCGSFQLVSSSPELFLRMSGTRMVTRPIKGTRPRSPDSTEDAQLGYELQTSPKELAELLMITDLLRNDLGRVSEFGSVRVPELLRLERFAQVQHLVSTVEGRLRPNVSHVSALAAGFPGGSITGAPKIRAMEIIDELEPVARGPYTGAMGYLGFNRESQLSIVIRTAVCVDGTAYFHAGAGIVADSDPAAEYEETLAKAQGFVQALYPHDCLRQRPVRS